MAYEGLYCRDGGVARGVLSVVTCTWHKEVQVVAYGRAVVSGAAKRTVQQSV